MAIIAEARRLREAPGQAEPVATPTQDEYTGPLVPASQALVPGQTPAATPPARDDFAGESMPASGAAVAGQAAAVTTPVEEEGVGTSGPAMAPEPQITVARAAPDGPGRLQLVADRFSIGEESGMLRVEIRRVDGGTGVVGVSWWTQPGSAGAGEDYADFGRSTETFADGERTRTIFVPIASDEFVEGDEDFTLHLGEPSGDARLGEASVATITILDND